MKKWIWAPAIAAPVVIVAGALAAPLVANAAPDLPAKTPAQVVALLASHHVTAFSGDVTVTSDLGLPSVSSIPGPRSRGGSGSADDASSTASDVLDLLTGTHDMRVYRDGSDARVQLMDGLAEKDVVVSDDSIWLYDSQKSTALHLTGSGASDRAATAAPQSGVTPDRIGTEVVDALSPSSTLTVDTAQTVAGRDAYTLVLTPKATDTLVGDVSIAVDASTGMPLSIEATARGASTPAFSVAFTSLDYATPAASLFDFTAPKDATVTQKAIPAPVQKGGPSAPSSHARATEPTVTGSGWDAVVTAALPSGDASDLSSLTSSPLFGQLATRVDGGWVLQTALVSVMLTEDGSVLAGSVPASALESAAR